MNPEQLENARKSINHMLNAYRQLVNIETSYPKESKQNEMMEELNLKVSSLIEETRATVGSLRLND